MKAAGLPPLLAFDLQAVSIAEGVRAALSVAVIVALDQWLRLPGLPGLMESALAALLTCLCDAGGPIRRRLPAILVFVLLGAAITAGFGLLRAGPIWLVVPVCAAGVFCTSFARAFGQSAMQVGNLLSVVLVLAVRAPLDGAAQAAALGGMFLLGGLWALLLTMVIWRLHPYRPARAAVAECYRLMAVLCGDLGAMLLAHSAEEARWDRHARQHRRQVREAIESARAAVLATVRARGPVSGRSAQSWIRLEAADQLFAALIALSDLLADEPDANALARARRMLRLLEPVLLELAHAIVADTHRGRPALEHAVAAVGVVARGGDTGAATPLARIAGTIQEKLGIATRMSNEEAMLPQAAGAGHRAAWWATLRSHLRRDDEVLRHAARAAAMAAPAFAVTWIWPGPYEHWLTITLVLTMQPYFAVTFARAVERIGGTVLGGGLAALLAVVCTTPLAMAAALFPLAVVALSVRAVSFGLFMACLTPMVVLLSELGRPGESEFTIALMRALFTLAGGVLALLGTWLLWPVWEPDRLDRELRAVILAHGRYAAAEIADLLGEGGAAGAEAARRAAGLASNTLETTLQRAMLGPRGDQLLDAAMVIDAAMRRMAGRLSILHVTAEHRGHDPAPWQAWSAWVSAASEALATGRRDLPPRPALPEGDAAAEALARIAAQLELVAGAMRRPVAAQSSPASRSRRMPAAG